MIFLVPFQQLKCGIGISPGMTYFLNLFNDFQMIAKERERKLQLQTGFENLEKRML